MFMTDFLNFLINKNWFVKVIFTKNGWLEFDNINGFWKE